MPSIAKCTKLQDAIVDGDCIEELFCVAAVVYYSTYPTLRAC